MDLGHHHLWWHWRDVGLEGLSMKNEPAFPNEGFNGWGTPFEGMSLRDYFAAKAMPRVMQDGKSFYEIAEDAYDMADAMLKAREA